MSFAKLVLFVDKVGNSMAARNRDDMFIKEHRFCDIHFWKSFLEFLSITCWGWIFFPKRYQSGCIKVNRVCRCTCVHARVWVHVSVGACSAGSGGEGLAGPGRAGFVKIFSDPVPDPAPNWFTLWKWSICRFSKRKWAETAEKCSIFAGLLLEKRSAVEFHRDWDGGSVRGDPILSTQRISKGPGSDFDLQEEARPRWNFIYTKKFPAAGSRFSLCKEFV